MYATIFILCLCFFASPLLRFWCTNEKQMDGTVVVRLRLRLEAESVWDR
jgi:hypothetical protein